MRSFENRKLRIQANRTLNFSIIKTILSFYLLDCYIVKNTILVFSDYLGPLIRKRTSKKRSINALQLATTPRRSAFALDVRSFFGYFRLQNPRTPFCVFPNTRFHISPDSLYLFSAIPWNFFNHATLSIYSHEKELSSEHVHAFLNNTSNIVFTGKNLKSFVLEGPTGFNLDNYQIAKNSFGQLQKFSAGDSTSTNNFKIRLLEKTDKLIYLDMFHAGLCDLSSKSLQAAFLKQTRLEVLKIAAYTIHPDFIIALLEGAPNLKRLELYVRYPLPPSTVQALTGSESRIQHLRIMTEQVFKDTFKDISLNVHLRVLDLSGNVDIPMDEFIHISKNSSIRKIVMQDYGNNRNNDMWLKTLLDDVLAGSLQELDIRNNTNSDIQVQIRAAADKLNNLQRIAYDADVANYIPRHLL